jgi:hypothetical protein
LTAIAGICFEGAEVGVTVDQSGGRQTAEMNRGLAFQGNGRVSSEPQLVKVALELLMRAVERARVAG